MRPNLLAMLACLAALSLAAAGRADEAGAASLTLTVTPGGTVHAEGTAPSAFPLAALQRRVPGIDLSAAIQGGAGGEREVWASALDALTVVLPRIVEGEVRLGAGRFEVEATLRPGFSAEGTRGALRLALGPAWETSLAIAEAPPAAEIALTWSRHGAILSGILPAGLAPAEALALLGGPLDAPAPGGLADSRLTGGGGGDAGEWRAALPLVGRLLRAYRHAAVRLGPGGGKSDGSPAGGAVLSVNGALQPGHQADRLERWLAAELGEGWGVSVAGTESPAPEGAARHDPVTGVPQQQVRGRWLPLHDFEPNPAACGHLSRAILAGEPITFVPGKAALAEDAGEPLDRLAGVARRCLNEGGLTLEISGHTDSIGDPERNLALSEKRAMAVLLELVLRGVRADAMRAVGRGASRAIAGNGTEEGRARNRRITFHWSG